MNIQKHLFWKNYETSHNVGPLVEKRIIRGFIFQKIPNLLTSYFRYCIKPGVFSTSYLNEFCWIYNATWEKTRVVWHLPYRSLKRIWSELCRKIDIGYLWCHILELWRHQYGQNRQMNIQKLLLWKNHLTSHNLRPLVETKIIRPFIFQKNSYLLAFYFWYCLKPGGFSTSNLEEFITLRERSPDLDEIYIISHWEENGLNLVVK